MKSLLLAAAAVMIATSAHAQTEASAQGLKKDRLMPVDKDMDAIVYGNPVFGLDGKPFLPPVVAGGDETPAKTIASVPYLPPRMLRGSLTPMERIENGHKVFGD
jgi:hypothetical protein